MTSRNLLVSLVLFLFAVSAFAVGTIEEECKPDGSYSTMKRCEASYADLADAELNRKYADALAATNRNLEPKRTRAALIASQQAWLVYRDRTCELASLLGQHGYDSPHRPSSCMYGLTSGRISELDLYVDCLVLEIKCPFP